MNREFPYIKPYPMGGTDGEPEPRMTHKERMIKQTEQLKQGEILLAKCKEVIK